MCFGSAPPPLSNYLRPRFHLPPLTPAPPPRAPARKFPKSSIVTRPSKIHLCSRSAPPPLSNYPARSSTFPLSLQLRISRAFGSLDFQIVNRQSSIVNRHSKIENRKSKIHLCSRSAPPSLPNYLRSRFHPPPLAPAPPPRAPARKFPKSSIVNRK